MSIKNVPFLSAPSLPGVAAAGRSINPRNGKPSPMNASASRHLLACALLAGSASAFGAVVTDQQSGPFDVITGNLSFTPYVWQQEVIVGVGGLLSRVDFGIRDGVGGHTLRFAINRGSGWQSDVDDFSTTFIATNGTNTVDLSGAGLSFAVGERFALEFQATTDNGFMGLHMAAADSYSGTLQYSHNGGQPTLSYQNRPAVFTTYMDNSITAAVPEPGTLAMVMLGLGVVGWTARGRAAGTPPASA